MTDITGQVAIVTGGTSGIGREVATMLTRAGADVAILSNAPDDELESAMSDGIARHVERVDIADFAAVAAAVRSVAEALGPATMLVNNAAIWESNPVPDSDIALFDRHIDVNLKGSFYVTQAVLPAMIEKGAGNIVFIGSVSGTAGRAGDSAYSASKAGVAMLSRTLAAELGPKGIRMNCVCPGAVATPLTQMLRTPEGEQAIAALMDGHPSPRREFFMQPAQIAELVVFLLEPRSNAVHGAVIAADEGLTATL